MQKVRRLYQFFQPEHYTLRLDLRRQERVFSGLVVVSGKKTGVEPVVLHSKNLKVQSISVGEKTIDFTLDKQTDELVFGENLPAGDYAFQVKFSGSITDPMHGLYPCYYEVDGEKKELLATQFESHHAREVFPCVDEPEAKATFDLTLVTETGVQTLSNMPIQAASENGGRQTVQFQTTPRMSTYLLAFVVGDLQKQTATTKSGVEVNFWATAAQATSSLAFGLDVATRATDFYDEYFATPYPLPKIDHVALPDFSAGAMENWGLITYRESALLAEPGAAQDVKEYVASVIAHELSHQWFGNLVTMRWWNNLWLNESFATIMEYVCVDALEPDWKIWDSLTLQESIPALRRDAIDGVQAVQTEVNHPDEISTLFDGAIVYAKGARLIRMLLEYVGNEAFRVGLAAYFKQFAYKNTEADDLWQAMGAVSGKDVAGLMNAWISQPGYPLVTITDEGLAQERFFVGQHENSSALWPIPLFASDSLLPEVFSAAKLSLNLPEEFLLNTGDKAHFVTLYNKKQLRDLQSKIANRTLPAAERMRLLNEQALLADAGKLPVCELVPLLSAYRPATEQAVWSVVAVVARSLQRFTIQQPKAFETWLTKLVQPQFERLGWRPQTGESLNDAQLRSIVLRLAVLSRDPSVTAEAAQIFANTPLESIDGNTRLPVLQAVMQTDDGTIFDQIFKAYVSVSSPELKQDLMHALVCTPSQVGRDQLLAAFKNPHLVRPQDMRLFFQALLARPEHRTGTWQWLRDNWSWVEETFAGDKSYDYFVRYCGEQLTTNQEFDEFTALFTPLQDVPALSRAIDIATKQIAARVQLVNTQSDKVISELTKEIL